MVFNLIISFTEPKIILELKGHSSTDFQVNADFEISPCEFYGLMLRILLVEKFFGPLAKR